MSRTPIPRFLPLIIFLVITILTDVSFPTGWSTWKTYIDIKVRPGFESGTSRRVNAVSYTHL